MAGSWSPGRPRSNVSGPSETVTMPTEDEIRDPFAMANNPAIAAERVAGADGFDPTRSWVDGSPKRLSDRLWLARQWDRDQIDALLKHAIATGEDGLVTAKKLEQFLDPAFAPLAGRPADRPGQNKAIVTEAPGRGGSGSFPARRLARTEITRAHGAGTIAAAEKSPFVVGVRWACSRAGIPRAIPVMATPSGILGWAQASIRRRTCRPTRITRNVCAHSPRWRTRTPTPWRTRCGSSSGWRRRRHRKRRSPRLRPSGRRRRPPRRRRRRRRWGCFSGIRKGDVDIANGIMRSVDRMRAAGWNPPKRWIIDHGDHFRPDDLAMAFFNPQSARKSGRHQRAA